jgi:hypothetical protein
MTDLETYKRAQAAMCEQHAADLERAAKTARDMGNLPWATALWQAAAWFRGALEMLR